MCVACLTWLCVRCTAALAPPHKVHSTLCTGRSTCHFRQHLACTRHSHCTYLLTLLGFIERIIKQTCQGRQRKKIEWLFNISEHELTFSFSICCHPSVCRLSVCNTREPYPGGCNFLQYLYGVWYLGHPLTSTKNFTEIVLGEPLRRGS